MSGNRETLPHRRAAFSREIVHIWRSAHGEFAERMLVTVGIHPDGRIGEVFIDYPRDEGETKKSERVISLGHDIAFLISVAIQYGAPLDLLRRAMAREDYNFAGKVTQVPSTIVGTVLDAIAEWDEDDAMDPQEAR